MTADSPDLDGMRGSPCADSDAGTGVSGRDLGEVRIEHAEGPIGQRPLGSGAECVQAGRTDRIGSLVQEIGSLGRVRAGVGKVAAVQFDSGEFDENQHALTTWDRMRLIERRSECLARAIGLVSLEEDVAGCSGQVRDAARAKRRVDRPSRRLVEGSFGTVESLARCHMIAPVYVDGGFGARQP